VVSPEKPSQQFTPPTPLNRLIRKATKKRKVFLTDESAMKAVYLAVRQASEKWTMPIRNWKEALNRFVILFEDHLKDYI